MQLTELHSLIVAANERFDGFSGNCAKFALALRNALQSDGTFLIVDSGHYRYADHVALLHEGLALDGDGVVTETEFRARYTDVENEITADTFEDQSPDGDHVLKLADDSTARQWSMEELEEYLGANLPAAPTP